MILGRNLSITSEKMEIRNSSIHRTGTFAKEFIPKDNIVGFLSGKIEKKSDYRKNNYYYSISENFLIVPESSYEIDPVFFINHSCEPNTGIKGDITLIALKDIYPNEEITIDYATIHFEGEPFLCNCGSRFCRGEINGKDILNPVLQKKYGNSIQNWIKQKLNLNPDEIASRLQFELKGAWGLVTAIDLHDCDPEIIRDRNAIYNYTIQLCEKIKVKRFGEPIIVHFGEDERVAGYSLVQLIETSLISGHFANLTNRVYLDIFSCAYYSPAEVIEFSKNFYKAKDLNFKIYLRY